MDMMEKKLTGKQQWKVMTFSPLSMFYKRVDNLLVGIL